MPSSITNTCHPHAAHQFLNAPEEEQFAIRETDRTEGSCKNKGTTGQMVCWKKDRDPLKAWKDKMTRGGKKTLCLGSLPNHPVPVSVHREKSHRYREAIQR
jgi:hypothetical protein